MSAKQEAEKWLKEYLSYNPDTGIFTWIKPTSSRVKAGSIAGGDRGKGYLSVCINGNKYYLHRLAWFFMTGKWPEHQVDHINHIKTDNRWVNLREVTLLENQKNQAPHKNNESGVTGVQWHKAARKWCSVICVKGKNKHLGLFEDKFEAICARLSANNKYGFHANHGLRSE